MKLEVAREALEAIQEASRLAHPNEACGILFGQGGRIAHASVCANVHPEPSRRFEIDPAALIAAYRAEREGDAAIAGYWHSHPSGEATPSATDRASAVGDGKIWAIVGENEVGFWRDASSGFEPLSTRTVAD